MWSAAMDVGRWLRDLGLGKYEKKFRDNAIDADVLADLDDGDLEKLGVPLGDRKRLLKAIVGLASRGPTLVETPAAPASLAKPVTPADAERRPITVMFCDLVGSTSLTASLDAEDWRSLVNAYLDEASKAVTGFGGHVLKRLGDGLMALFGYPAAQENDAERAVRTALAIQRALVGLNARNVAKGAPDLKARIGIESGLAVVEANGEVFGDAPNVAARVEAAAEPGAVLITAAVQRQVAGLFVAEDQGARELKGVAAPVQLFRITRASGAGRRGGARALTPFVGREDELGVVQRRWERALAGEGQLVLIVGEPGLGKSRLIEELRARLADTPHTWVEWSASQLLQNTALHPIAEWGRLRFGADAPAEARLADLEGTLRLIGLDPAEYAPLLAPLVDIPPPPGRAADLPPEEMRRRQLAAMTAWVLAGARSQPVVLAFEDLQWADPTSLDLLRALAERGAQARLLVLASTRPEFHPPWSLRSHHSVISLSPLDRAGVARMVGEIATRHALSKEVIEGVSERTGGVPLFVEEVTRLLLERGEQGGIQAIPPTLQQSLAARLDRLGPAREIAQIGALLGRDFAYALLRDISDIDEPALQAALERLADADLLFVEGAPPQATYRFKHALIQDAAYDNLLKSRRQALHRRAAEALVAASDPEPEVVAHHFTQASLDDKAIEWWGKAGDQALRRSAFQEAIAHLGKAIEMADKGVKTASSTQRVKLQAGYGLALTLSRGAATAETRAATARTQELVAQVNDAAARFATYRAKFMANWMGGEIGSARLTAEAYLEEARAAGGPWDTALAAIYLGQVGMVQGVFGDARKHLTEALDVCGGSPEMDFAGVDAADLQAYARAVLALVSWQLGEVDRAQGLIQHAVARVLERRTGVIVAITLALAPWLEQLRGDAQATLRRSELLSEIAERSGFPDYSALAKTYRGWARARLGDPAAGLPEFRNGLAEITQKTRMGLPLNQGLLAELDADDPNAALAQIDEALALAEQTDQRWTDAFLHRLRGEILLKRNPADPGPAEEAYRTAIGIAKQQGARSYELLASLSLAKLNQSSGRPAEAHAVLAPALEGFAPTPEMPEIAEAQALLTALGGAEEVKAQEAQRQRRVQLHVAYGNALIATRGFGAPETTEAFAKAREAASSEKDAPERLAIDYGLWTGSHLRGELAGRRAHAAAFLGDVESRPDSPEAGVAHRAAGMTHLFAGEYREAQLHLKRALALFQPGRDDDLAFRFGQDAGVSAMANLAHVLWPRGELDRATSLIDDMQTRAASLTHVGTRAFARWQAAMFELLRGGRSQAAPTITELGRLAREHNLRLFFAFGVFLEGWSDTNDGAPADGLDAMRRGVDLLRNQKVLMFDGLVKIALAEAEFRAGDPERALGVLDEALATAERADYHAFEAELHLARGEMLLTRDPANPAPAESAFRTAIAIAKQQGTRSFELRASLSLAKLYQSTARPAEAHAVLASALEGFSPTLEMPEIAEAQALSAALAETHEVKSAAARRQRRLKLQTDYGQAMLFSKGYGAEETRIAFADALKIAAGAADAAGRFATYYGIWAGSVDRGDLTLARQIAEIFRREAADEASSPSLARACVSLGLVVLTQGDPAGARAHLEEALKVYDPGWDREAKLRFGTDVGALASAYLATASWLLGDVAQGRELIDLAVARAIQSQHATTKAFICTWAAQLEAVRGDAEAIRSTSDAMVELCRNYGLKLYLSWGKTYRGWARARLGDREAGVKELREGLASLADQGSKVHVPFYQGLLAEIEAEMGESALSRIDDALALARETGEHWSDSFLHRIRGEILLKLDPANVAAEQAFRAAIAVAQAQKARSFELQAALGLAKLYRSTARPAEAHAVLSPALEGFSATPEMPEIAEAQALMEQLA
jgi:class 3 adenylate cyclase/predicted ATPase